MDLTRLIPVTSFENYVARLSSSPDYQRCVTSFFKAHSFYIRCPGLFAGTSKATGKRAVYCDQECFERLSAELAAIVAPWLGEQTRTQVHSLPTECVEDVQALNLQSEDDVKALFKDFKRTARYQKQCRQLAAARELLLDARRWTAPFHAPQLAATNAGCTPTTTPAEVAAAPAAAATAAAKEPSPAPVTSPLATTSLRPQANSEAASAGCSLAGGGGRGGGSNADVSRSRRKAVQSHPLVGEPDSGLQTEDEEGTDTSVRIGSCDGPCGEPSRHRALACAGQGATTTAGEITAPIAADAGAAVALAASRAPAGACDGRPALRALHTAVCADPWVSAGPTSAAGAAAPPLAGAPAPLASGCSSLAPSSAATPMWPPTTPHYGLASPCAAATAAATPPCDSARAAAAPAAEVAAAAVTSQHDVAGGVAVGHSCAHGGDCLGGGAEGVLVVCCSIDLEWWERDNSRVTEVGWTMWDNLTRSLESRHHIVAEHEALVNRIHVPDHKHDFLFGRSTSGSLAEGAMALQADLEHYGERVWAHWCAQQQEQQRQQQGQEGCLAEASAAACGREAAVDGGPPCSGSGAGSGAGLVSASSSEGAAAVPAPGPSGVPPAPPIQLVVVGHGLSQDLKALSGLLGVMIPATAAILDTADLAWAALEAAPGQERTAMSLRVLLKALGIPATKLHNGGNDARYTMEALLALAALDPPPAWAAAGAC
ncbi:hypothetical protein PLESTB_000488500 [Pleodorina starrii]|uniref:Gfd2/YDR514C-like C-terminal domain-containing protein n=1 Tax=Pleodorina starrii TaxID=330485 RepID=A0A9W6BFV5_9CHLO|nr:hypothetical protein PLESTM_000359700 [Pleodorina starrii]GLC51309.1 hypothetical protein PLESTB_000488500 [Pleodorina starrii]GLC63671.1 hypothetical protein PLESTF_000061700 [Pleodorina starrii]